MEAKSLHKQKQKKSIYTFRGRAWIDGPKGTFLGYGRVVLLERIREYGSITQAAKSMDMSYRHAWELVNSMNRQSSKPFVVAATGGKGGGGALITAEGEKAIKMFWKFYADFQEFLFQQKKALRLLNNPQNASFVINEKEEI